MTFLVVLQVFLKQGPYGYYIQVGEDRKGSSQKRAPLSEVIITLVCTLSFQKLTTDIF
jgi:topoisomerase IA-like protein